MDFSDLSLASILCTLYTICGVLHLLKSRGPRSNCTHAVQCVKWPMHMSILKP